MVSVTIQPQGGGGGKNTTETDEPWLTSPVIVINAWKLKVSGQKFYMYIILSLLTQPQGDGCGNTWQGCGIGSQRV